MAWILHGLPKLADAKYTVHYTEQ